MVEPGGSRADRAAGIAQYGWDFVFLRANRDAVDTGSQMGSKADKSLTVDVSPVGVSAAFSAGARDAAGGRVLGR